MALFKDIDLHYIVKKFQQKGKLVYEYNPFRNYRTSEDRYYYENRFYTKGELEELGIKEENNEWKDSNGSIVSIQTFQKGQLIDFDTEQLQFNLTSPVDMQAQYSYDGSVNLILNDGKNKPKLINSRFSAIGKNEYQIVDRKGNNDTNIYDEGSEFDLDTSLYKNVSMIPKLSLESVSYGGNLSVGNYHFYFKYADQDGNTTDFVAESGLVSIFIGSSPKSITSGFRHENSHKLIKFRLQNIDSSYKIVRIFYTKSTSDLDQDSIIDIKEIDQDFIVDNNYNCDIVITGFENTIDRTLQDVNPQYQIYGSAETQAIAQNMLFLGNVKAPEVLYQDLSDISLRFLPELVIEDYFDYLKLDKQYNKQEGKSYDEDGYQGYYNPLFIYNKVGYHDNEIYRFGIVYILSDNTLTPVFNVRGINGLSTQQVEWSSNSPKDFFKTVYDNDKYLYETKNRKYIEQDNNTYIFNSSNNLENIKGVIRITNDDKQTKQPIIGINFKLPNYVKKYLKGTLNIKGFFFVRQKRIPTTLCQAYTIGTDRESYTPLIPIQSGFVTESFLRKSDRYIVNDFLSRMHTLSANQVRQDSAICPEYDINYPYLNNLFTGSDFIVKRSRYSPENTFLTMDRNHFCAEQENYKVQDDTSSKSVKILGVPDNTKLVAIGNNKFRGCAGEAGEAFRFEYIGSKTVSQKASNLLRGIYGPFLATSGYDKSGHLIDIMIPGYDVNNMKDYFLIRYNDKSEYYPISDRIDLSDSAYFKEINGVTENTVKLSNPLYRGDCYICQFTHRVNRNFQDPSAPTNDTIVDDNTWEKNYKVEDGVVKKEQFSKIKLGDLNAVRMGMLVTFTVRSTFNLNVRALDKSNVDEMGLTGHPRGFYPYQGMFTEGSYKIPEALCYNKGFEKSLSEKWNFEEPDVPAIKNNFSNRICFSEVSITDAFKNGFRVFPGTNYTDYPKTYGTITKLVELKGNLLCVFEHGIALIAVNERALSAQGDGGNVYINSQRVLPVNPVIISDTFGSQWKESVIKTPTAIYGVDTIGKKIWRTNGQNFECISDMHIQEFLNNNITLGERELTPIIGIRNVKTHYNKYKNDVMFTFYDNLEGFEERAWNVCFNEATGQWTTFYSWIPSYSENIQNQYFSFDRDTSKKIAKLGISNKDSSFSEEMSSIIVLDNNIINVNNKVAIEEETDEGSKITGYFINIGTLSLKGYENNASFSLTKDSENKGFKIVKVTDEDTKITSYILQYYSPEPFKELTKDIYYLKVRSNIDKIGSTEQVIAVTTKEALNNKLSTDFWKHGQAGIIDIQDDFKPTHWYGKQHIFEFEFVMATSPDVHKIFDNLQIISNSAEPDSFHYEIIGDCYEFEKDKINMYIRQEAIKELHQYNGVDIVFNPQYKKLKEKIPSEIGDYYSKSTIFPAYYYRKDTFNEIEDSYKQFAEATDKRNYDQLSGSEIVYYKNLDEFRIWNHAKAINMYSGGRLRGNMQYIEDRWNVQINPINIVQKNEKITDWQPILHKKDSNKLVPAESNLFKLPDIIIDGEYHLPNDWSRNVVTWGEYDSNRQEVKMKDKFIKIRVRYNGEKLAIISAVKTLYSIVS